MEDQKMGRVQFVLLSVLMCGLYMVYIVWLFLCHPFVACAAEQDDAVPGGKGNMVVVSVTEFVGNNQYTVTQCTMTSTEDSEILAFIEGSRINFQHYVPSLGVYYSLQKSRLDDITGYYANYINGKIYQSWNYTKDNIFTGFSYKTDNSGVSIEYSLTGCKLFKDKESMKAYVESGSLDGMVKEPVLDKEWYLKNVNIEVTADDSPSSEAGEDATYIRFTWDTDNLQEGDLIEIKTHNYYKTLTGEEHGGYHDYITWSDGVSASTGEYGPFSQYEATKAWFRILEHKPLLFKSYDTDVYYIRPYRNGKVGGWVRVPIKRNPLIKGSPYMGEIEYGDFDKDGNWVKDKNLTDKEGGYGADQNGNKYYPSLEDSNNIFQGTNLSGLFKSFFDFFKDIPSMLGGLPGLVNSTIGFLPNWVIGFIAIGIIVVIILRIVGR